MTPYFKALWGGGGSKMAKNADVINERPLKKCFKIEEKNVLVKRLFSNIQNDNDT